MNGRSLLMGILTFLSSLGLSFAVGGSDIAPILSNLATGLSSIKQAEQANKASSSSENQPSTVANTQAAQAAVQNVYASPVQNFGATGYPVLDPYQLPGYWQNRQTAYATSMTNAQVGAQKMNEAANRALEAERTKTNEMLKLVGSTLETAGGQMEKIGAEKAKEAEEAKKKDLEAFKGACREKPESCRRVEITTGQWGWELEGKRFPESELGSRHDMEKLRNEGRLESQAQTDLTNRGYTIEEDGSVLLDGNYIGNNPTEILADLKRQDADKLANAKSLMKTLLATGSGLNPQQVNQAIVNIETAQSLRELRTACPASACPPDSVARIIGQQESLLGF